METGLSTVFAQHMIISFKLCEITSDKALEIGADFCSKFLKNKYQYYLAVHTNKSYIHLHCIFNNTNMYDYRTFETHKTEVQKLRKENGKGLWEYPMICAEKTDYL